MNVSKHFSSEFKILIVVPQGSFLGPLLFIAYIYNHPLLIENGHTALFADETTITVSSKSSNESLGEVKNNIGTLMKWTELNQLQFNPSKSCFLSYKVVNGEIVILT